jgi:hypothetical protein
MWIIKFVLFLIWLWNTRMLCFQYYDTIWSDFEHFRFMKTLILVSSITAFLCRWILRVSPTMNLVIMIYFECTSWTTSVYPLSCHWPCVHISNDIIITEIMPFTWSHLKLKCRENVLNNYNMEQFILSILGLFFIGGWGGAPWMVEYAFKDLLFSILYMKQQSWVHHSNNDTICRVYIC